MDLLKTTKELCRIYEISPQRSKGQNFLIAEDIYEEIIKVSELKKSDTVLEVGPGLGFLTEKLASQVKKVLAVELDKKLAEILQTKIIAQKIENIEIIPEDILNFNFLEEKEEEYKIVANLPYNISSIFLRKFLTQKNKPELLVLMLQKEVGERIVAKPGAMSLLAVSVQFYATAEIIKTVPADNFWPKPAVESVIIKIRTKAKPEDIAENLFWRLVKFGFSAKRKMLKNNLANGLKISQEEALKNIIEAGYNPKIRAQELSVSDWLILFAKFKKFMI